ncbi:cytochrome P450 [Xylaria telfairii]|nr:cytochrome P450 [Xylaria telfairii]
MVPMMWFTAALPSVGAFILGCGSILLFVIAYQFLFTIRYPANLPLINEPPGKKSFGLKTRWRYYKDCKNMYLEAYKKYTKNGRSVLVPGLGARDDIILPQNQLKWVLSRPESALSHMESVLELNQTIYSLGHNRYFTDGWHMDVFRSQIDRNLESFCPTLNDEISAAITTHFGADTMNWKEIDLLTVTQQIVGQVASRLTVGLPLCRDTVYINESFRVINRLIVTAAIAGGCPRFLRPLVARLSSIGLNGTIAKFKKSLHKTYKMRVDMIEDPNYSGPEPHDHLQMMLRFAQKQRPEEFCDFDAIAKRVIMTNSASLHPISILVTNLLLNIVGSDKEFNTIEILREEVTRITSHNTHWTKKFQSMVHADSAARETMRLHSAGNRFVLRKVMKDGLMTEDGVVLPKGSTISFLAFPLQVDSDNFEDARKYDPFRYSRARETATRSETGKPGINHLTFVSTSPDHLAFSHGRHACPGRFLVDFIVKMIIAYIITKYDIVFAERLQGKRPSNVWIAESNVPPGGVTLQLRRRSDVEVH